MSRDRYESVSTGEAHLLLDFEDATRKKAVHDLYIQNYKDTARTRTTGRKVLVLGCTAYGEAFKNLPIGEEVDELICDDLLTTKIPPRGIWIWGNGEPIMLVNDNGFREYQFSTKLDSEGILKDIGRLVNQDKNFKKLKELTLRGFLHIIEDEEEYPLGKANLICELLKIPKRGNRQKICTLLQENLPVSV